MAFKRWTKALGDVVMVMVVLTDPDPFAAVKRLLARAAFILIPLSVLLVKYYPEWGRGYDRWTWTPYYGGRGDRKERSRLRLPGLRARIALACSLGTFSRRRARWHDGPRIAHGVVLAMTLWLFWKADSATSLACFFLGGAVAGHHERARNGAHGRRPHFLMGGIVFLAFTGLLLDAGIGLVEAMGRDTTLTGRTDLWDTLLTHDRRAAVRSRLRELLARRAGREALADLLVAPEAGAQRLPRGVPEPGMGGRRPDRPARRAGDTGMSASRSAGIQRPRGSVWRFSSSRWPTT